MSGLNIVLPNSVQRHIQDIAAKEGVSIDQFISSAISEKISAIMTEDYLSQRAKKADRNKFREILNNVPNKQPLAGDEL
ncbi:hypothetical protein [Candidatus Albibeggiatoa sp. nov. NOAA]|uniref:hypothetical protein n=1 Tax=Candidatus Albibeggiatoa sp. nov. NOAA TaxID=3162724 RepID=UPI0032FBC278|nr:hypothetical protein [Thiotrichaceae bacterium]